MWFNAGLLQKEEEEITLLSCKYLESHAFALVVLRFSGPPQESTHVFSDLTHSGRGSYGNTQGPLRTILKHALLMLLRQTISALLLYYLTFKSLRHLSFREKQFFQSLTVVILQDLVVDGRGHANSLSREIGVVVKSFSECDARWRLTVTSQQAEDVVLSSVSEGTGQTHIRTSSRIKTQL